MSSRSQSITKSPNQQLARVSIHRLTKRQEIVKYFSAHFGVRLSSTGLHARFGSSFRSRVSEINHDSDCPITIQNETTFVQELEQSVYWSQPRVLSRKFRQNDEQQYDLFSGGQSDTRVD